jgi:hypothetical protein
MTVRRIVRKAPRARSLAWTFLLKIEAAILGQVSFLMTVRDTVFVSRELIVEGRGGGDRSISSRGTRLKIDFML